MLMIIGSVSGSHDSFAYWFDTDGPLAPDSSNVITDLEKVFGSSNLERNYINSWALTQTYDIPQQLALGIRYFDLRIATKPNSEDLYVAHTLYGIKLETLLENIKTFLDAHPKEVVLLDFNHFYRISSEKHKQCLSMILRILGLKNVQTP